MSNFLIDEVIDYFTYEKLNLSTAEGRAIMKSLDKAHIVGTKVLADNGSCAIADGSS
jgi:hypothetical protein